MTDMVEKYDPYSFCLYFERYTLSPKIRPKRVGVIKDKICILKIQDTLHLSQIGMPKCQDTQIKDSERKKRFSLVTLTFSHMRDKAKCLFKIQI